MHQCAKIPHHYMVSQPRRLGVFENGKLRTIGSMWEEVTGGWRKLHNEELHNLYSSPNIISITQVNKN